jgi:subtilisin family serine protease
MLLWSLLLWGALGMNPPDPSEYVVQFRDPHENALAFAEARGLSYAGPVPGLAGYHRFTLKRGLYRNTIEDPDKKVEWMERQVPRQQYTRDEAPAAPTDPLYRRQWHLEFTRAKQAWDAGYMGEGVRVAIVDDGLQHTHPDLSKNYIASSSLDFNGGKGDPSPGPSDFHGTACAGKKKIISKPPPLRGGGFDVRVVLA